VEIAAGVGTLTGPESSAEVDRLRTFRDRLAASPGRVALYIDQERRLIDTQVSDRSTYTQGMVAFIQSVLARK
jgi:GrpB-like predicted nucleotidyltransferase (UPF0157 family)